mmetsp:Transcript_4348/g.8693  ORF Transcript_4348/g.8693 Transcript_4348/m.8693 type:complete len:209 (+) Transcript_4348:43-669(+)
MLQWQPSPRMLPPKFLQLQALLLPMLLSLGPISLPAASAAAPSSMVTLNAGNEDGAAGRLVRREISAGGAVLQIGSDIHKEKAQARALAVADVQFSPTCTWSTWSVWTDCTKSCGTGKRQRLRVALKNTSKNRCESVDSHEDEVCSTQPCPIDCHFGPWTTWTQCSKSCGPGKKSRHRHRHPERHGGQDCKGSWEEERVCEDKPCTSR